MEDEDIDYGLYSDIDSDTDLEHMDDLSLDLEGEVDAEFDLDAGVYFDMHLDHPRFHHRFHNPMPGRIHYDSDTSGMYSGTDDEEEGSLDGFVAPDEEPARSTVRRPEDPSNQRAITISDDEDESDEGGAVSNRIPRRRARARFSPTPSVVTVTDNGTNDSDAGDMNSEMLRTAGWSPLDQGNDSEAEEQFAFRGHRYGDGYESSDVGQSDNESDTETMVGNGDSGGDEDRSREDYSETPTYDGPPYIPHEHMPDNYESLDEDADDDDSEAGFSGVYDRDGDTEMSASPRASRSVSINTDGYDEQADYPGDPNESRSERSVSRVTDDGPNPYEAEEWGNIGGLNQIHDIEDEEESDDSPRPPPRRRLPNQFNQEVRVQQQYDPRISRMFADHQQSLRGAHDPGRMVTLAGLSEEARRYESRNRRMTSYRNQPSRRNDPLRSSRSPSANGVIASSSRNSRPPRQYMARGYN
jgi:hypothetical protein